MPKSGEPVQAGNGAGQTSMLVSSGIIPENSHYMPAQAWCAHKGPYRWTKGGSRWRSEQGCFGNLRARVGHEDGGWGTLLWMI